MKAGRAPIDLSTIADLAMVSLPLALAVFLLAKVEFRAPHIPAGSKVSAWANCAAGPCWLVQESVGPVALLEGVNTRVVNGAYLVTSQANAAASVHFKTGNEVRLRGAAVYRVEEGQKKIDAATLASDFRYQHFRELTSEETYRIRFIGDLGVEVLNPRPDSPIFVARFPVRIRIAFLVPPQFAGRELDELRDWEVRQTNDHGQTTMTPIAFGSQKDERGTIFSADFELKEYARYALFPLKQRQTEILAFTARPVAGIKEQLKQFLDNDVQNTPLELRTD